MGVHETTIHICSGVRLNSKYEHTVWFPNVAKQQEYFSGKVVKTFSDYSFVRRFYDLEVEATMEEAKSWSYLFLTNGQYPVDYYYYFINRIEYVNPATVRLSLEMDVIQSYLFNYSLLPCFVERQHASDDSIGAHTLEEGLDVGEYVDNLQSDFDDLKEMSIYALSTINLDKGGGASGIVRNGVFLRAGIYKADLSDRVAVADMLGSMEGDGTVDAILNMWVAPTVSSGAYHDTGGNSDSPFLTAIDIDPVEWSVSRPNTLDGYSPKNNKLLCYPYNFAYVTNHQGGSGVFKYEFSSDGNINFELKSSYTPDGGVLLYPTGYKGVDKNLDEAMSLSGFPICAWTADEYRIWLAQNMKQNELTERNATIKGTFGVVGGLASAIGGIALSNPMMVAGGVGAAVSSGYSNYMVVQNLNAQKEDRDIQPPQARGSFSSPLNIAAGCHTFTACTRTIRTETAKVIDDYFTMYGYKVNRVQTPNIHAREHFTFVKTVGCHVYGSFGNEDAAKIEDVFNNGVTFWTSGDQIGNYSLTNNTL